LSYISTYMTTKNNDIRSASIDAVIYMKNGEKKYGVLVERPSEGICQFISNVALELYERTSNDICIEKLSCSGIEAIDLDPK
jgi:hypothetical protein